MDSTERINDVPYDNPKIHSGHSSSRPDWKNEKPDVPPC